MIDIPSRTVRLWNSGQPVPPESPSWVHTARQRIHQTLTGDEPYPCHFGVLGERGGKNFFTYLDLDADQDAEMELVSGGVSEFLTRQRAAPGDRRSLLIMVGPPQDGRGLDWYRRQFWDVLSLLSRHDDRPPPADAVTDTDDPLWNFFFGGESLFVFGTAPAYGPRRSRVLADCLVIGLQSRSVFHGLGGNTDAGRKAKRRIRRSLATYDDVPLIADAGDGLGSTVFKWKQYLPDVDGKPESGRCPFDPSRHAPSLRGPE